MKRADNRDRMGEFQRTEVALQIKSVTYSVQIANYKSAILSAIPEPGPLALLLAFSPILVFVSARRSPV